MLKPLIAKKLAVGPSYDRDGLSPSELKQERITAIIDLNQDAKERDETSGIGLTYVIDSKLKIPDNYRPIPVETLRYATARIHHLILEGHYVYLHCSASLGRSPTIAAAYLICLGKKKTEAMNMVRVIRPRAWLGADGRYAELLDKFEQAYLGNCVNKQ